MQMLQDCRLAVLGYSPGHPPTWLELQQLALAQAWSPECDGQAVDKLRGAVREEPKAAEVVLARLVRRRHVYGGDRAFDCWRQRRPRELARPRIPLKRLLKHRLASARRTPTIWALAAITLLGGLLRVFSI